MFSQIYGYYLEHIGEYWSDVAAHLEVSFGVAALAALIGIPLGIVCALYPKHSGWITGLVNVMRIIPSLALMLLMIPLIGIGRVPAFIALMIIAIPPVLINTTAGFLKTDSALLETAGGMGMDQKQIFRKVQFPLAIPLIFTGIRTSIVETIASATIATYIGAGGLGNLVFTGLGTSRTYITLLGGLTIALISIVTDCILAVVQSRLVRRFGMEEV